EWLIPLPLKPRQVMLAKFSHILLSHYALLFPLAGPVLVQYGILEGRGPGYALRLIAMILMLPLIPLAISALVVILLMRVVNLGRHKEILVVAGTLLLMLLALLPQFLIQEHDSGETSLSDRQLVTLLTGSEKITRRITAAFPPARWAVSLLDPGTDRARAVIHPLLLSAVSLAAFLLLLLIAEKLFYYGLVGIDESSGRRRAKASSLRTGSGKHPVRALFLRELRLMNRVPMFLLNGMYSILFIPVFLLVMISTGHSEAARLLGMITSTNPALATLAVAAAGFLAGVMNGTASSAVSREGHSFWISRVIPVHWLLQIQAKFMHAAAVAGLGIALTTVMMGIALSLRWWIAAMGGAMALTAAAGSISLGLLIDLSRPLLDWISPQRAIKQNLNVFFSLLLNLALLFLLGLLAIRLNRGGLSGGTTLLIMEGILIMFSLASLRVLLRIGPRLMNRVSP
ncbi:MAG: hypothetical protein RB296_06040, partial [Acidobacteriota bacterium]|nr:hypothetical protein [Acidobacteriota bacterium]